MARSIMKARELPNQFWTEAVATTVYLLNLSPTKAVPNMTPYEAWRGIKPWVSHLKVFGCIAYALVKSSRQKLDEKSEKCIFVGYSLQSKAYRLYNPISGKIIISRDVVFNEEASWNWNDKVDGKSISIPISIEARNSKPVPAGLESSTSSGGSSQTPYSSPSSADRITSPLASSFSNSSSETPPRKIRSLIDIYESCNYALLVSDPESYADAEKEQVWKNAMVEEMDCIKKNDTWELVDLPEGKKAIGLKWVYRTKYSADNSVLKHKAWLVAKGYAQRQGIDFDETFSPVARFETVRTFLAFAAQLKWPVFQFDVKSAFLNGELKEEVFVSQPEGFVVAGHESKVYKLKKALYGLKQAPRAWYHKIDSYFCENGFNRSDNEPTLYLKQHGDSNFLVVCLYVDDMIYMGSSEKVIADFKSSMMQKFEMSDLGLLHYFLGIEVKQSADGIFISQRKYAMDLLKRFRMLGCKTARSPMNVNEKLRAEDGTKPANARWYRSMVGGLNYLSNTRPDIAHSVSVVSRFMHNPTKHHFGAVKRIIRYVAGTIDFGIWYSNVSSFKLFGFSDSDWAGCIDDRRSTSGYVFTLGSGAISWSSKKQDTVALSSSEAEYAAITSAACQAVWLLRLLADFLQPQQDATEIYCDNKSAIAMTKNAAFHGRMKHIDIRHHFIRDLVADGTITLKYCGTNEQIADIMTKSLSISKVEDFRMQMGVYNFEARGIVE